MNRGRGRGRGHGRGARGGRGAGAVLRKPLPRATTQCGYGCNFSRNAVNAG
jgi:hypothetical protein